MEQIQRSLKQLQEDHMVMKQQYADEIHRLRHKLDHSHKGDSDGRVGVSRTIAVAVEFAGGTTSAFYFATTVFSGPAHRARGSWARVEYSRAEQLLIGGGRGKVP